MLSYSAARGGVSTAKYRVQGPIDKLTAYIDPDDGLPKINDEGKPADTFEKIVTEFASIINGATSEWCPGTGDFKAIARGATLMVMYSELLSDITFHAATEGPGKDDFTIEIEVFG